MRYRILVICDEFDDANELGEEILLAGHLISLHWSNTVASLRTTLGEGDFDLALCDEQASNIDIITARGLIAEGGQDFPFIVISRNMTPEAQKIASQMKAGVDDFVEWGKPERLVPAVEMALRTAESHRQNRIAEQEIHYRANFDSLTDLPNRTLMLDRLSQAMKQARRDDGRVLLMFLDLDHFKTINDSLGHLAGDLLLSKAARRIEACLRDTDTAARIGGDEFAIVLPDTQSGATPAIVAGKLLKTLSQPFLLDGCEKSISVSIGITAYPADGDMPEQLLSNADQAMYAAKRAGRNAFRVFSDIPVINMQTIAEVSALRVSPLRYRPVKYGLALAAALALAVFASSWLTSVIDQDSLKIAIDSDQESLPDFSTASGPDE